MTDKKKMSNRVFRAILIPIMVVLFALVLGVTIAMNSFAKVMNFWFGPGKTTVTPAEGTEDWNTDYYGKKNGSKEAATANAARVSEQLQDEGIVMLKNNGALPLDRTQDKQKKVSAFGWSFSYPVYGGTGSNKLDPTDFVTPEQGLEAAGFEVNSELTAAYTEWANTTTYKGITGTMDAVMGKISDIPANARPINDFGYANWDIIEMPVSAEAASSAAEYSDVALIYLSRQAGENGDVPTTMGPSTFAWRDGSANFGFNEDKHYLQLSDEEEALIDRVTAAGFDKVVVVLNSLNIMQVDDLENDDRIDSVLWVGGPGEIGFKSLGKVLSGEVTPSGKTASIWAADFTADPTFVNYADPDHYNYPYMRDTGKLRQMYSNINADNTPYKGQAMVQYEEGIYVGYRYYETAHDIGKEGFDYDEAVTYPFGYGLSYTTFSQRIVDSSLGGDEMTVTVEVTNTGDTYSGKDVVQLYVTAPYHESYGIEKSTVALVAFGKTDVIEPGGKDTVTLTFAKDDLTSYDYKTNECYVLDDGEYVFSLRSDSHDTITYDGKEQTLTWNNADRMIYNAENDGARLSERNAQEEHKAVDADYVAATNAFDDVLIDEEMEKMTIMTRSDRFGRMPEAVTAEDKVASDELIAALQKYEFEADPDAEMPTLGADNGLNLIDMRGLDYEDPAWDSLLDQLTVDDMLKLVEFGYGTEEITSINAPSTYAADSPQCLQYAYWSGVGGADSELLNAYPCLTVIACTWNAPLAHEMGDAIGEEAVQWGVAGWYAPGLNLHRSPFGGRNFEYFSEDPVISGEMCAAVMSGASDKGLLGYVKHFALNDQESFRQGYLYAINNGVCTWADEQTIRELYLKPFETVVKESKMTVNYIKDTAGNWGQRTMSACVTVMSSFNRIGSVWAGGSYGLLTQILRNEWGFRGQVMTDFRNTQKAGGNYYYMDKDEMLAAGGDSILATTVDRVGDPWLDTESATAVLRLRNASKNVLYAIVHSNGMQGIAPGSIINTSLAGWQIVLIIANVVIYAAIAGGIVWIVLRALDAKKHPERYASKSND